MNDWYGKMPVNASPLNDTFIRACIKTGALTPPLGSTSRGQRVKEYAGVVFVLGIAGLFAVVVWANALMSK